MRIVIEGVEEYAAMLHAADDFDAGPALERSAEIMRDVVSAQDDFPYETGDLLASGRVDGGNLYWDDLPYAGPVEEDQEYFWPVTVEHLPGIVEEEVRRALEDAVEEAAGG